MLPEALCHNRTQSQNTSRSSLGSRLGWVDNYLADPFAHALGFITLNYYLTYHAKLEGNLHMQTTVFTEAKSKLFGMTHDDRRAQV